MRKFVFVVAMLMSGEAFASCELISGPRWTQGRDTYTMEKNFGGSYNTYRNGDPYSQTQQNLSGNYRETIYGGGRVPITTTRIAVLRAAITPAGNRAGSSGRRLSLLSNPRREHILAAAAMATVATLQTLKSMLSRKKKGRAKLAPTFLDLPQ